MRPGALLAAVDDFTVITVRGRGGHAAYPQGCVDPVPAALRDRAGAMAIRSRRLDPLAPAVISLTVLRAGEAANVIPETAGSAARAHPRRGGAAEIARRRAALGEMAAAQGRPRRSTTAWAIRSGERRRRDGILRGVAADVVGAAMVTPDRRPEMGPRTSPSCCRSGPAPTYSSGRARGGAASPRLRLQRRGEPDRRVLLRAAGRAGAAAAGAIGGDLPPAGSPVTQCYGRLST